MSVTPQSFDPRSLAPRLGQTFAPLVDLVYPPRCPLCGDAIAAQKGLCFDCWQTLEIPGEPSCKTCSRPFSANIGRAQGQCDSCLAHPPRHDGIAAGAVYNDAARQLVLSFKHGRKIALAPMLAQLIAARLSDLEGNWLAVPVPLHRNRLWQRGFNQSALLARELAKRRGLQLLVDGLVRPRPTPSLGGLGRQERAREMAGAIAVRNSRQKRIAGAQILLVDDVLTSGATSSACVEALKTAGAHRVKIACFARVLDS